jgi:hypothetical protein
MKILRNIIEKHERVALLIGNGPNLAANIMPSWQKLLQSISPQKINFPTDGLSNTEIYDLIELGMKTMSTVEIIDKNITVKIKQKIAKKLWLAPNANIKIHKAIMKLAIERKCPVLTTNFDKALEKSVNAKLYHITSKGFTRFYPWKSYYGLTQISSPIDDFGIWKIHGDVRYVDSIRLGLTDYMGSVERARRLIHKGDDRLFNGKNRSNWSGGETWLHIWFNMPIVIFGFSYDKDEVFLRWLLIEKKRYCKMINKEMNVYYISKDKPKIAILNLMKNLDCKVIEINDYMDLYTER